MSVGLDHLKRQRAGTEHPRFAVGAHWVVHRAVAEDVEHSPIGEGEIDLYVVGVPLIGDGLDTDAGDAERAAVIPDPRVYRFAGFRVVGLPRPDELPLETQAASQIDGHG